MASLRLFSLVILSLLTTIEISSSKHTNSCVTPKGVHGNCIALNKCESLASILEEDPINRASIRYLQNSTCGFNDDKRPLVCCPKPNSEETHSDITTTQHDSPLITTEKPPELPSGENNQTESSSKSPQIEPEKIISNENLLPNSSTCGKPSPTGRIVGGMNANLGAYPWIALLGFEDVNGNTQWACGGSLISKRYVLTAAHCVSELPSFVKLKTVKLGEYNQSSDPDCFANGYCAPKAQIIQIEEIIPHENFDETKKKENDIALIRLEHDAHLGDFVRPVCLPRRGEKVKVSKDYIVAGFGRLAYDSPDGSNVLQYVKVPILTTKQCNNFYADKDTVGRIDKSRFCAGGEDGKDSCKGDSGGPLMIVCKMMVPESSSESSQIYYYQYGIVSLGPQRCGVAGQPALYTSTTYFRKWIVDHIRP